MNSHPVSVATQLAAAAVLAGLLLGCSPAVEAGPAAPVPPAVTTSIGLAASGAAASAPSTRSACSTACARWTAVLHSLDADRAQAYARNDSMSLRATYVDGSAVLRADREMLGQWSRRGVAVVGLRMRVLALQVRHRRPGRVTLDVVDQLADASALVAAGRVALPHDLPTEHLVLLRRESGRWQIAAVRRLSG